VAKPGFLGPFAKLTDGPAVVSMRNMAISFKIVINIGYLQILSSREYAYTGCPRRNVPDFERVFLMLKYTDITQNTYVQI